MNKFLITAALAAVSVTLAACENRADDDVPNAEANALADEASPMAEPTPDTTPTPTAGFPEGARIVEENGVTFRIDPDGTRVQLEPGDSHIMIENGVRYRVDPHGTRARIGDDGAAITIGPGRTSATIPIDGDTSVTVNTN